MVKSCTYKLKLTLTRYIPKIEKGKVHSIKNATPVTTQKKGSVVNFSFGSFIKRST